MRYTKKSLLFALIVIVAVAVSQVALATPDEDDVTVIAWQGAPGCTFTDARILISNESSVYDYKVAVVATAENDENGNAACSGEGCFSVDCECTFNATFETYIGDDEEFQQACVLPNCQECSTHCDNLSCNPVGHCTTVSGYYAVTWYRESQNGDWTMMSSPTFFSITEKQLDEECP